MGLAEEREPQRPQHVAFTANKTAIRKPLCDILPDFTFLDDFFVGGYPSFLGFGSTDVHSTIDYTFPAYSEVI